MICPFCKHEVEAFFECEHRCSYQEIFWCEHCGAIAVGHNGIDIEDDEWSRPKITSMPLEFKKFKIIWKNGEYKVNIPNLDTTEVIKAEEVMKKLKNMGM